MSKISLSLEELSAEILPDEGAVMAQLEVGGRSILASTPWANRVEPSVSIAADEPTWVSRWRGGWQLCAPTAGQPDPVANTPAFHGAASQAAWKLVNATGSTATFEWTSPQLEFSIERTWSLLPAGRVQVSSKLKNLSASALHFGIAEHLILGGDLLRGVVSRGESVSLHYSDDALVHELDYAGAPTGQVSRSRDAAEEFRVLNASQAAKVFALTQVRPQQVSVATDEWHVKVEWDGLAHALVWQEFASSTEHPWNAEVLALGIEPTTTPHGVGSAAPGNPVIEGNSEFEWTTTLVIQRRGEDGD